MTRKNGGIGGRRIINLVKKRITWYILLLIAGVVFSLYTFHVKNRSEGGKPLRVSPKKKKEILRPIKKNPLGLPRFQNKFIPYGGEVKIEHDIDTPDLREATGLDGMGKEEIAAFRLQKISIYQQLGIYEPNYHPFKEYHLHIYRSITPGQAWLGPTPYYIANPYQLVVLTCANHVTPLNLYCPDVRITYSNGVFETIHQRQAAICWFIVVYRSPDFPGQVWPITVNAWDAGFFYAFVDLSRSENVKENNNPGHITNRPLSGRYIYHVGKYGKNNLSPAIRNAWLTLNSRDTRTVIYIRLWRNKPGDTSRAPDLSCVFKILP